MASLCIGKANQVCLPMARLYDLSSVENDNAELPNKTCLFCNEQPELTQGICKPCLARRFSRESEMKLTGFAFECKGCTYKRWCTSLPMCGPRLSFQELLNRGGRNAVLRWSAGRPRECAECFTETCAFCNEQQSLTEGVCELCIKARRCSMCFEMKDTKFHWRCGDCSDGRLTLIPTNPRRSFVFCATCDEPPQLAPRLCSDCSAKQHMRAEKFYARVDHVLELLGPPRSGRFWVRCVYCGIPAKTFAPTKPCTHKWQDQSGCGGPLCPSCDFRETPPHYNKYRRMFPSKVSSKSVALILEFAFTRVADFEHRRSNCPFLASTVELLSDNRTGQSKLRGGLDDPRVQLASVQLASNMLGGQLFRAIEVKDVAQVPNFDWRTFLADVHPFLDPSNPFVLSCRPCQIPDHGHVTYFTDDALQQQQVGYSSLRLCLTPLPASRAGRTTTDVTEPWSDTEPHCPCEDCLHGRPPRQPTFPTLRDSYAVHYHAAGARDKQDWQTQRGKSNDT